MERRENEKRRKRNKNQIKIKTNKRIKEQRMQDDKKTKKEFRLFYLEALK